MPGLIFSYHSSICGSKSNFFRTGFEGEIKLVQNREMKSFITSNTFEIISRIAGLMLLIFTNLILRPVKVKRTY